MKSVLMIAFQFPPYTGSSAVQRTLRFVRYLPESGWKPIVLTAQPRGYEFARSDQLDDIPAGTIVHRAFCLDTARHLGLFRRYPRFLARPDRWISWWLGAIPTGLRLIRRHRPVAIWSTFPIPTAHMIGASLSKRSGLPWIADFRDPMVQEGDPADPYYWHAYERIERCTVKQASVCVFTTSGTRDLYRERYRAVDPERLQVIENGYDEEVFSSLTADAPSLAPRSREQVLLVHSGAIYPLERDPTCLFRALRQLSFDGLIRPETLRVRLRATGHDEAIARMIRDNRVEELVELAPPVPYREAIREMLDADGLIILQGSQVRSQIPAKVYEYLRVGRPILGLTDPTGDTAQLLRRAGVVNIARSDSDVSVREALHEFLRGIDEGRAPGPDPELVRQASRRSRTRQLAQLLDRVHSGEPTHVPCAGRSGGPGPDTIPRQL